MSLEKFERKSLDSPRASKLLDSMWEKLEFPFELKKFTFPKEKFENYKPITYSELSRVEKISPKDIYYHENDFEGFSWEHHGNDKESYHSLVNQFSEIERLQDEDYSLEEIRANHPELSGALDQGFKQENLPRVMRLEDKYVLNGDGRHRTLAAKEFDIEKINVRVTGEYQKIEDLEA